MMFSRLANYSGSQSARRLQQFYFQFADVRTLRRRLQFRSLRQEYYAEFWRTAARNIGAEVHQWKSGYLQISRDGLTTTTYLTRVMLNSGLSEQILESKELTHDLLSRNDYPVPKHVIFTKSTLQLATEFLDRQTGPIVVKPAGDTAGGRGVTTGIETESALKAAVRIAARYNRSILAEEQVSGASYRLLYVGGELIDAVRRDPPVLAGDGRHTIRQLIKFENLRRLEHRPICSLMPLFFDADCENKLATQGLTQHSIPEAGRVFDVKQAVNANTAAENHNVRADVHESIVAAGSRLVTDLGLSLGGIDLQCSDISVPLSVSNGRFIEINSPAGLHHHYLIAEPGSGIPVAEVLLEYMFSNGIGVMRVPLPAGKAGLS